MRGSASTLVVSSAEMKQDYYNIIDNSDESTMLTECDIQENVTINDSIEANIHEEKNTRSSRKVNKSDSNVCPLLASSRDKNKNSFSIDYILGLSPNPSMDRNDQECSYRNKCETLEIPNDVSDSQIFVELSSSKPGNCDLHNTLVSNFIYQGWIPHQSESIRNNYNIGYTNDMCKY